MVLFKKLRPRRGSLAVSIICGSPIAASSRSAALAYRIGSPRHDSRYSAIDISVSLLASKDLAKALNRESLYMNPSPGLVGRSAGTRVILLHHRSATCPDRESASAHEPIGHASDSVTQCNSCARAAATGKKPYDFCKM